MKAKLKSFHIDQTEYFNEQVLKERPGRQRCSFAPICDIEQIYQYFKTKIGAVF